MLLHSGVKRIEVVNSCNSEILPRRASQQRIPLEPRSLINWLKLNKQLASVPVEMKRIGGKHPAMKIHSLGEELSGCSARMLKVREITGLTKESSGRQVHRRRFPRQPL